MSNATIVEVDVIVQAGPVDRRGFSTIMVAGQNAPAAAIAEGALKRYTVEDFAAEMLADGWTGSEAEYKVIAQIAQQTFSPPEIVVGHVGAFTAQVSNVLFTTGTDGVRTLTIEIGGQTETYTVNPVGQTITQIRTLMKDEVDDGDLVAQGLITTGTASTDQLTITSAHAGQAHSVSKGGAQSAGMTLTTTTPNAGYQTALTLFRDIDSDWFGIYGVDADDWHITERAVYAEANKLFHAADTTDADAYDSTSTGDILAYGKARNWRHTRLGYHPTASEYEEASLMGNRLALDPDETSTVWYGVTLVNVSPAGLNGTKQNAIEGKNGNHYNKAGGQGFTSPGVQCDGKLSDVPVLQAWMKARLQEAHMGRLLEYSNAGKKLPYTDEGINVIEGDVRRQFARAIALGHMSPGTPDDPDDPVPSFSFPSRAQSLQADKAAHIYRYTATGAMAGSIFKIKGTVYLT